MNGLAAAAAAMGESVRLRGLWRALKWDVCGDSRVTDVGFASPKTSTGKL